MSGNVSPLRESLSQARATRNSLAGSVRSALLQLERTPAGHSPDRRARHEVNALHQALAALIASPPEPRPAGVDAELAAAMRVPLDVALELAK